MSAPKQKKLTKSENIKYLLLPEKQLRTAPHIKGNYQKDFKKR